MVANIRIEDATWPDDEAPLRTVRQKVFVEEQSIDPAIEWDSLEPSCQHFIAYDGERPIATGRLSPAGKIGRMAVLPQYRGSGIGRRILDHICDFAREHGHRQVHLHAQSGATAFYEKSGFQIDGPGFVEAGIDHLPMSREL
ncbi:GNAT family N-acetyltransferase [Biformimicrobium ophioploci]|uniref:GNAT family N-acetyltransferase n=1 Tax=Biformimicrobium ophioploci TaxID=3036711 RepID=A0ABQ6M1H7_9GAMM|nr:GNAT family N-acetyltransferase [Microbulbifer sp. NKW57]